MLKGYPQQKYGRSAKKKDDDIIIVVSISSGKYRLQTYSNNKLPAGDATW
jgi:hypothetical protein